MPKAMSIEAIRAIFVDEWVAAIVTKVDKADVPIAGTARIFVFFTGELILEGVGVAFALG